MTQLYRIKAVLQIIALVAILFCSGCDLFTDPATRLAYDIESAAKKLKNTGDRFTLYHETPSKRGECSGPYTVQLDKVGALVIWCNNENGEVLSSSGTSYHRRFVHTPETYYLDKEAGDTLVIELEQKGSQAVIVKVY
jgi:hypothetical protein